MPWWCAAFSYMAPLWLGLLGTAGVPCSVKWQCHKTASVLPMNKERNPERESLWGISLVYATSTAREAGIFALKVGTKSAAFHWKLGRGLGAELVKHKLFGAFMLPVPPRLCILMFLSLQRPPQCTYSPVCPGPWAASCDQLLPTTLGEVGEE